MGGFGSGRGPYANTATVAESFSLVIADLKDHLDVGESIVWQWGDPDDPKIRIGITAEGEAGPRDVDTEADGIESRFEATDGELPRWVRVNYSVTPGGATEPFDVDDAIPVTYTAPPMGGLRPWFRCPDCQSRREELHLPRWDNRPGETAIRFRCRECHELGYETSRASGTKTKEDRVRFMRAFARADAQNRRPHPNQLRTPERPSGRHESTHEDLVEDVRHARAGWEASYHRGLAQFSDVSPFDEDLSRFEDAEPEMFLDS